MNDRKRELTGVGFLLLGAMIWGAAFSAQSIAAEHVPAFSFLALRTWIGLCVILPLRAWRRRAAAKTAGPGKAAGGNGKDAGGAGKDTGGVGKADGIRAAGRESCAVIAGCFLCGFFLFAASAAQQIGIAYTTTAKSGFITALYVVIVPLIVAVRNRGIGRRIAVSVLLAVTGLYLLCMKGSLTLGMGDAATLLCAFLFSMQILAVNAWGKRTDGFTLTMYQFIAEAVLATLAALCFEHPSAAGIRAALGAILYVGVMSSGFGYLLQTLGQQRVNPAAASILMSLESVFSALAGWVILGQKLTGREFAGCAVMFSAILLAELPIPERKKKKDR